MAEKKKPANKSTQKSRALHEATTDARVIKERWRAWRSANIGVATGAESGIVVLDMDLPAALASLDRLVELNLPRTLTGLTGGGGLHLVCSSSDDELGNSAGRLRGVEDELPGVDLRANGGYIVARRVCIEAERVTCGSTRTATSPRRRIG